MNKGTARRLLYILLLSFVLLDLGYSFIQHINQPLDGDMAWNIIPAEDVKPILESPLGLTAIINDQTYANPNRFFCHWSFREYLRSGPLALQNFVEPIESIYLSCGISKIVIQILILILLAFAIAGTTNMRKMDFILAALLITPLFQTNGYQSYMGIIDGSTTYTFFYALPAAILLLYFIPFFLRYYHGSTLYDNLYLMILWIPLAFVVCLSGPLNPGVVLIVSVLLMINHFFACKIDPKKNGFTKTVRLYLNSIPRRYYAYLTPVVLLSLYSLFLGRYNSITLENQIPLADMYLRLPEGIYYQFTQKLGFPILFGILLINSIIIHSKFRSKEGKKVLTIFKWIGIFSLCYIILLPLGGYREYRPNILRYDTIMPITISLIFMFGISSLFLLKQLSGKQKRWYLPLITGVLLIFTNADNPAFDNNQCEKEALVTIANSKEAIVALPYDCRVLEWKKIDNPKESELNAQLLTLWGVTKENKYFYNY